MIVSYRSDKSCLFSGRLVLVVSDDILEMYPRNSSEDGLPSHPPTDLSEA